MIKTSKSPDLSDLYVMKSEWLKWDFCAPKACKKWKKETLGEKKSVLELKKCPLMEVMFLNRIRCLLFLFFLSIFKWLLMLWMLSKESCLLYNRPVLVAYKLANYNCVKLFKTCWYISPLMYSAHQIICLLIALKLVSRREAWHHYVLDRLTH